MSESASLADKLATIKTLTVHKDNRGNVRETFRASWFPNLPPIKQLVRSKSKPRTLRGMHLHRRQHDVWHFVAGHALVRLHWPARSDGEDVYFHATPCFTIAIPPAVSHGFYTPDGCTLLYALTEEYDGSDEFGWYPFDGVDNDAEYSEEWPLDETDGNLLISQRDLMAPRLVDFKG